MGWVNTFVPNHPKSNLSPQAQRGRKWVSDAVRNGEIFVTRADKGGAILVMDYDTVVSSIERELNDTNKYRIVSCEPEQHRQVTTKTVRTKVCQLQEENIITIEDREKITGLNSNGNMKHNPEYRPGDPKIYPLFKLHKLSAENIEEKRTPPARSVNNAKHGPLYRLEKWMSPYLTRISQAYCKEEFVKDTDHLLEQINQFNSELAETPKNKRQKFYLATLDVAALYPSIRPEEAMKALKEACDQDITTSEEIKTALLEFSQLIFDHSYVKYKDKCYQSLVGIPTGGCTSRQTADCMLHKLIDSVKGDIPLWKFVKLFRRFIDDIFTVWYGTKRQFDMFVSTLNELSARFGIRFGEWSIGESVNFLDVTLFIDQDGFIQYRLYRKPTDSRMYLKTHSFHPRHVFDSVAYSQLHRVKRRNSDPVIEAEDLQQLKSDLVKCGHKDKKIEELLNKLNGPKQQQPKKNEDVITLVVPYFQEIAELKNVVQDLQEDICILAGQETKVLVAARKGQSIGNKVVKNNKLCETPAVAPNIAAQK